MKGKIFNKTAAKCAHFYMCSQQRINHICQFWELDKAHKRFYEFKRRYQKNVQWAEYLENRWIEEHGV